MIQSSSIKFVTGGYLCLKQTYSKFRASANANVFLMHFLLSTVWKKRYFTVIETSNIWEPQQQVTITFMKKVRPE